MADSRIASLRLLFEKHSPRISLRTLFFFGSGVAAYFLSQWLKQPDFTIFQQYTLFLVFFAVGLWVTEAIPPFAVSILVIGFLVYTQGTSLFAGDAVDVSKYVNTWSSPVIWLMLGGFFMAKGMEKTRLDVRLFSFTVKVFGTQLPYLLLGLMLTTSLGSMLMSNTATTAMMLAAITPLLQTLAQRPNLQKALLLGIPAAASVGGMGTIIGSPPNAIAVGALSTQGIEIDFVEWMLVGFPLAIVLTICFWLILMKHFEVRKYATQLEPSLFAPKASTEEDHRQRNIVLFTIFGTVGMWVTSPLHHIPVSAVSGIPIVVLTVVGVVNSDDVRSLPWDTLMLVAGGLALGIAIIDTGLAESYLAQLNLSKMGEYVIPIMVLIGLLTVVLSNIMSNTATSSILIPIAMVSFQEYAIAAAFVIGLSASNALFLPISTPPNAMAFSTGFLQQKDFRLGGLTLGVLGPICVTGVVLVILAFTNLIG